MIRKKTNVRIFVECFEDALSEKELVNDIPEEGQLNQDDVSHLAARCFIKACRKRK